MESILYCTKKNIEVYQEGGRERRESISYKEEYRSVPGGRKRRESISYCTKKNIEVCQEGGRKRSESISYKEEYGSVPGGRERYCTLCTVEGKVQYTVSSTVSEREDH